MKFSNLIEKLGEAANFNSLASNLSIDPELLRVTAVDEATSGSLSYVESNKFVTMLRSTSASALILPLDEKLQALATEKGIAWVAVKEPRLIFARAIALFYQPFHPAPEINPTAAIAPSAKIGKDVFIGAYAVIGENVTIEERTYIHPHVVIYPGVTIGRDTILHANCTIHERSQIGSGCVVHSGAVIGAEGFGFVPVPEGWFKMQQSGYVVLEDGVEIGCNTTVDRPAVGITKIGKNTKIDNLVQIGHGCQVGENCAIAAQVGLAGGVKIGNRVILAGQVGVANQAKIGDGAIATAKTGIHNDVEPGEIVSGYPGVPHAIYLKVSAIYKKIPEMYQTLKKLQKSTDI
jgi:UDP-3-O-[3-hydroxymyristoyl] glucosamine N-acyltransferase